MLVDLILIDTQFDKQIIRCSLEVFHLSALEGTIAPIGKLSFVQ